MESLPPGTLALRDFMKLTNQADLDAIVIVTPLKSYYGQAKAALLARKHVLVEKPMAASEAEYEKIIRTEHSPKWRGDTRFDLARNLEVCQKSLMLDGKAVNLGDSKLTQSPATMATPQVN